MRRCIGTAVIALLTAPVSAASTMPGWLAGCWAYDNAAPGSGEYWMRPAGGSMIGVSRTVRDNKTIAFEYLRIEKTDTDTLVLIASPSGQQGARFPLQRQSASEIIFENPDHDFPQRIIYRLGDDDSLLGRIEGQSDGRDVAVDFPMSGVDCESFGQ